MMLIVKFGLFEFLNIETALSAFNFSVLILATVLIAAGGNVINDLYDVEIDIINKPKKVIIGKFISEKAANVYYIFLTFLGVIAGFYVANSVGKPGLAAIFIGVAGLLYMYASQLKSKLLLGNIIISFLVALSLLIVILFDIFPAIILAPSESQLHGTQIILHYALFAFYINFIREIVKDLQDINGDRKGNRNTLAIAIGRKRTITAVFILGIVAIAGILVYMYLYLYTSQVVVLYFLFALVAPLLFFVIKAWSAEHHNDYTFLSLLLKIIMLLGVISIYFQKFLLTNYA
ncbi:geranylgeranylglycerol-phosphate geranylgeranyltransferase [Jejudonia soesokkakensis]|uniref:Geranylgeranylglycerol-phosphate geranylgeranyltransferase n=1 Tax=Jejudonia soesokkakensis TaxID=1323432 RepID=A0ABW2MXW0_9FLAO